MGQEGTEDGPGRGSSLHRHRGAALGAPPGNQQVLGVVGTPRRRGLRWCEGGHAEGPSRAAEDVKQE